MDNVINFRLPGILAKKLNSVCTEIERPKSFIIRKALEQYIDEFADYQIALDRLHDKDDPIISAKDLAKQIKL